MLSHYIMLTEHQILTAIVLVVLLNTKLKSIKQLFLQGQYVLMKKKNFPC